jgi:CDP-diglyceride synthetase
MNPWSRYLRWRRTAKRPKATWLGTFLLAVGVFVVTIAVSRLVDYDGPWWWVAPLAGGFSVVLHWPIERALARGRERRRSAV